MPLRDVIAFTNRRKVAVIAQKLLDGEISVIAAAREIGAYRGERVGLDEFDPDFVTFLAIDSETDHLPIGTSRQYWAPDALAQKDLEIARCEELHHKDALGAAARLVARFAEEGPPKSDWM